MSAFCSAILSELNKPACLLTVIFVGKPAIRALNRRFLNRDYPTDVLSFGYGGETVGGRLLLGDIIIAPEIARVQALRFRSSHDRELRKLLVHGILHLLGHDHEVDNGEMKQLQSKLERRKCFRDASPLGGGGKGR